MTDMDVTKIKKLVTDAGHHWTRPRYELFQLLMNGGPMSTKDIISQARGKSDRVSVYRNVALFEQLGVIHRLNIGWKYKLELSDQFVSHHHHLNCLNCGRVIDIEDEEHIDEFIGEVSAQFGFQPKRHQFEIDGLCSDCQLAK